MPSLADIPPRYLNPDARADFLAWLRRIPITYDVRRRLASIWCKANRTQLTADEHTRLKDTAQV